MSAGDGVEEAFLTTGAFERNRERLLEVGGDSLE
jgi:hypothetical protein